MLIRNITLAYEGHEYVYKIEEKTDTRAMMIAIHRLEEHLHKVRGGLVKHFKQNPDDVSLRIY